MLQGSVEESSGEATSTGSDSPSDTMDSPVVASPTGRGSNKSRMLHRPDPQSHKRYRGGLRRYKGPLSCRTANPTPDPRIVRGHRSKGAGARQTPVVGASQPWSSSNGVKRRTSLRQRAMTDKRRADELVLKAGSSMSKRHSVGPCSSGELQAAMDVSGNACLDHSYGSEQSDPISQTLRMEVNTVRQERKAMLLLLEDIDARIEALSKKLEAVRK